MWQLSYDFVLIFSNTTVCTYFLFPKITFCQVLRGNGISLNFTLNANNLRIIAANQADNTLGIIDDIWQNDIITITQKLSQLETKLPFSIKQVKEQVILFNCHVFSQIVFLIM